MAQPAGVGDTMRIAVWRVVALTVLLLVAAIVLWVRDTKATFATSGLSIGLCRANGQIASQTRDEIGASALSFVELFARSPMEARQQMSRRGRAATADRAPLENVQAALRSLKTVGAPAVTETYLLRFLSGSEHGLQVPCDLRDGGAVFVSRGGTPTSAVALISEEMAGSSRRTISVWLEHEDGDWRVRALHVGISRIAGMDSEQLWQAARQQRAGGNGLNAAMLYGAARSALHRGSFYQAHAAPDFNADMQTFVAPEIVRGPAPHTWRFGEEAFHVTQVQYVGFEFRRRGAHRRPHTRFLD